MIHLPECPVGVGKLICICQPLRACEERLTKEYRNRELNGAVWLDGYADGWDSAITAAREAVRHALGPLDETDPTQRDAALAAIDVLRGER